MRLRISHFLVLITACGILALLFLACLSWVFRTGYEKVDGQWTYIVINGAVGREVREMNVDEATFHILKDRDYAADETHVYKYGRVLEGIDGGSFEFLDGNNYARDSKYIYYRDSIVVDADPATFRVLEFPYARDAKNIYCGSLRMNVAQINAFRVIDPGHVGITLHCYSTEDLVDWLGEEFSEHEVLYDDEEGDSRFVVTTCDSGKATDGIWLYHGPKRLRRVEQP